MHRNEKCGATDETTNNNPKRCKLNFERVTNGKLKMKCTEMRNVEQLMRRLDELQSSTEGNPSVAIIPINL